MGLGFRVPGLGGGGGGGGLWEWWDLYRDSCSDLR